MKHTLHAEVFYQLTIFLLSSTGSISHSYMTNLLFTLPESLRPKYGKTATFPPELAVVILAELMSAFVMLHYLPVCDAVFLRILSMARVFINRMVQK